MFAAALSVILLGIHIGLHMCHKQFPRFISIIVSSVILCGGIYGIANSSRLRWLSMPIAMVSDIVGEWNQLPGKPELKDENKGQPSENSSDKSNNPQATDTMENKGGGKKTGQPFSIGQKVQNVLMFAGMILSCTVITYWVAGKKEKNKAIIKMHKWLNY